MCNMSAGPQAPAHPPPHALALIRLVAVDLPSAKKVKNEEDVSIAELVAEKPEIAKEAARNGLKQKKAEDINAEKGSCRRSLADAFVLSFEEESVDPVEAWSAEDKTNANLLQVDLLSDRAQRGHAHGHLPPEAHERPEQRAVDLLQGGSNSAT